ncbi:MAG: tripartite tricarboxylate transporter substrate binding protein [Pirellulaceae bacterium]|nr:tripartite tricarboxylate transporter substrate binding protein [Pirellulaceae bacterium]MDP6719160.1 tripartite tricarboxylate transporter substrate binding protein [Pirellulaceae bacterium]
MRRQKWMFSAPWLLAFCLLAPGFVTGTGCGQPAAYPNRSITLICPWAVGGGTDRVSRFWADALQKELGKPVTVVNRTGGSGAVGHSAGANARPDGYTLTTITFELCTMHRMGISPLTFDDYACLLQINADPAAIIVRNDAPWKTMSEFLEAIRADPGKLKMSGTAIGGAWDLARAGLMQAAHIPSESVIWVPTEGAAPSLHELLGGHIDAVCCSIPEAAQNLEGQTLRALVVMSEERLASFPDVPTAKESGVDWIAVGWRGLALPKATPPEIVQLLEEKCLTIANSEAYREFMQKQRFGVEIRSSNEFTDFLQAQDEQWHSVVEAAGYARQ